MITGDGLPTRVDGVGEEVRVSSGVLRAEIEAVRVNKEAEARAGVAVPWNALVGEAKGGVTV